LVDPARAISLSEMPISTCLTVKMISVSENLVVRVRPGLPQTFVDVDSGIAFGPDLAAKVYSGNALDAVAGRTCYGRRWPLSMNDTGSECFVPVGVSPR